MKFLIIPEHAIQSAAEMMEQMGGDQENTFTSIMNKISVFKQAEMTPVILMDPANYVVYVTSEETFMKKLH